jgi:1,4-alpha-glucan branching enzyme
MANLIEFKLFAPYNKEAAVIGCFSNWQPVAMKKDDDGYFKTEIKLKDGEYEYKFKVRSLSWFLEPDE